VADKLMRRAESMPKLEPSEDKTVTTLYVGNLSDRVGEKELREHFYQYGEIRLITVLAKQQCAFIQFTTRAAAELAAERTFNKLILAGRRLTIRWGRAQGRSGPEEGDAGPMLEPVPGLPAPLPMPYAAPYLMPPPMARPPPPPFFFPPPGAFPPRPPPIYPPGTMPYMQHGPNDPGPPGIHYPSQDPSRLGKTSWVPGDD